MFYTLPLIYSYFSFIYDNYSDIQLSYNYYKASYDDNHTTLGPDNSSCSILLPINGQVGHWQKLCILFFHIFSRKS